MAFKNPHDSHNHSLEVLNLLYEYDTFLESLSTIADMGCGAGLDAQWWATLTTRDEIPEPYNYRVFAIDKNIKQIEPDVLASSKNIGVVEGDFEEAILPVKVDLIWAHDSFQHARNPLKCLATWKKTLNENGMLVLSIPQTTYMDKNRLVVSNYNHQYYSYNVLNLIYMLAINGFDCRDAFFYRKPYTPWLYAAVYASEYDPILTNASWVDLAERKLIDDSLIESVNKYGYARLDDLVVRWLDKDFYRIHD
jgi:SAM-dependent methyltransferase